MERLPRGKYTKEFRVEAVKLITEGMLSEKEAGRRNVEFDQSFRFSSVSCRFISDTHSDSNRKSKDLTYRSQSDDMFISVIELFITDHMG